MNELFLFSSLVIVISTALLSITKILKTQKYLTIKGLVGSKYSLISFLPIYFILVNLLYALPLPIRSLYTDDIEGDISPQLNDFIGYFPFSLILESIFIGMFSIIYCFFIKKKVRRGFSEVNYKELSITSFIVIWIAFMVISINMLINLSSNVGGVLSFILLGYSVTEQFIGKNYLVVSLEWIPALSVLLMAFSLSKRWKFGIYVALFLLGIEILSLSIMGRRASLTALIMALLLTYHYGFKAISFKKILVILFILFIGLNLIGLLRGDSYDNLSNLFEIVLERNNQLGESGERDLFYTLTTGNFTVPFESFPQIISRWGDSISPRFGLTFLNDLSLIIPNALWESRPLPLANWYMREFYDSNAAMNEGRQFFFLSESYLNFGPIGTPIWALMYGYIFSSFIFYVIRRLNNPFILSFMCLLFGSILNLVASDLMGGLVSFIKGYGFPLIILMLFSKIFKKSNLA